MAAADWYFPVLNVTFPSLVSLVLFAIPNATHGSDAGLGVVGGDICGSLFELILMLDWRKNK